MKRFRMNNTDGFGQGDLDDLNCAFDRIMGSPRAMLEDDINRKSWEDHIAEMLLDTYDPSMRFPNDAFDCLVERLINGDKA